MNEKMDVCDFIFVVISNVCPICHRLQGIINQNVHDLDPDLKNWTRLNVNMSVERPHATFNILAIAKLVLSITVARYPRMIFPMYSIRIFDLENEGQGCYDSDENST